MDDPCQQGFGSEFFLEIANSKSTLVKFWGGLESYKVGAILRGVLEYTEESKTE